MAKIATFYDHIVDISRQENMFVVDALKLARELGVEAVEASANNILGREDEFGQEIAMADMEISAIPAYFHFERDTDVKRQAAPILEAAQFLGAPRLLVIPGFWEEGASPQEREAQTAQMVGCVEELAGLALDYGVSLVMEEYDNELSPIATMEGVRRFLDGCPALSCAFDTGNFRFANQAVALVCGISGSFLGILSLLFPPALTRCIPWGYYGLLSLVGMNWDPDTRFTWFYWEWPAPTDAALLCLWAALFLLVGRALFVRKEV